MKALQFELTARFGHFRRIEGSTSKQTYKISPRTTIIGLLSAICGYDRDSYYDTFDPSKCNISIVPLQPQHDDVDSLTTTQIPQLQVNTEPGGGLNKKKEFNARAVTQDTMSEQRQRYSIEYVRRPRYKIYFQHNDQEIYDLVKSYVLENKTHYTTYLGTTECITKIKNADEVIIKETSDNTVQSIVPTEYVSLTESDALTLERTPYNMEQYQNGRRTTEFLSYAIPDIDNNKSLIVKDVQTYKTPDNNIIFI